MTTQAPPDPAPPADDHPGDRGRRGRRTRQGGSRNGRAGGGADGGTDEAVGEGISVAPVAPVPHGPGGDDEFFGELTWRSLLRPNRSSRPGTMPAGMVLVVITIAMLAAMLVNADAIERKSNSRNGDSWRHGVASFLQTFSGTLHITDSRRSIDVALGRDLGEGDDANAKGSVKYVDSSGAPQVAQEAKLRNPTFDQPLKLWVGGDSLVGIFGNELQKITTQTGLIAPVFEYKESSGLTNKKYYDWPRRLGDIVNAQDPDIMVVMFGANDIQGMAVGNKAYKELSPDWLAEYRKRVGDVMDQLQAPDGHRLLVWAGALPMGPRSGVRGMPEVNYIYWSEAQKRPWVRYFDSWNFFLNGGVFSPTLKFADGEMRLSRERDDVHLTFAGGDRLAWAVVQMLATKTDLTQTRARPPADQSAPPDVQERPEVPKPEGFPG